MAKQSKVFHVGDLLSVTTGRMVSPSGIDGIYNILNFMTGSDLFTHQLPRAAEVCGPVLLRQYPVLSEVVIGELDPKTFDAWLANVEAQVGTSFEVDPLPADAYTAKHPLDELAEMSGSDHGIIVVNL